MTARGAKKEEDKSSTTTPAKSRDMTKSAMGQSSGLKRPTTTATTSSKLSTARQTNGDSLNLTNTTSKSKNSGSEAKTIKAPGLKKPSEVQKIDLAAKMKEKLTNGVKEVATKVALVKRVSVAPAGPASAETDELDEIYKQEDPIEATIGIRKKAGSLQSTIVDKNAKSGKFFFTLRTKGEPVKISEEAKKANAIMEGRTDAAGNVVEEVKP